MTTKKGYELAMSLNPLIGTTSEIVETCGLIARHATTHHRYMEIECSVERSEKQTARDDLKVEQIEARITELVESLPDSELGPFEPLFQGDPRGATVKIKIRGVDRNAHYDDWGREGICVPTR